MILYPPKTSPFAGVTEVIIGVPSCLYSIALLKVNVLNPSLNSAEGQVYMLMLETVASLKRFPIT